MTVAATFRPMDPVEREIKFVQGSGRERRGFSLWLARERMTRQFRANKQGEWTQDDTIRRVRELRDFSMSHATYAQLESGAREPSKEQYDHLTAFFGTVPPDEIDSTGQPQADIAAAIRELAAELRISRQEQRQSTAFLTDLLGVVARMAGGEAGLAQIADAVRARTPANSD